MRTQISKQLQSKAINYTKASTVTEGIGIQPTTQDLKIVVRGLHNRWDTLEIKEDLEFQGFSSSKVTQMVSKINNQPMPLYLLNLPRTDKQIYEIKTIIGLYITVKNLKAPGQIGQCFRCQQYGHSQSFCKAEIKCFKCSENYGATDFLLLKKQTPHTVRIATENIWLATEGAQKHRNRETHAATIASHQPLTQKLEIPKRTHNNLQKCR